MLKLVMTKGLPGSGKSFWSKSQLGFKRVNKDDLRAMLDNGKWSRANEKNVLTVRDTIIHEALENNFSVIVDDTNLAPKHEKDLKKIADAWGAVFEIKDFTDVSVSTCIKRDLSRPNSVGEAVIKKMYEDFLRPPIEVYKTTNGLNKVLICDLDGTLALFGDSNPYQRDFMKDEVNENVAKIVRENIRVCQRGVILCSGRDGKFRKVTEKWLAENDIPYTELFMRQEGDNRKDCIIKREIFENNIRGKYNVDFVLDDRDQCIELWRSLGLTALQVAYGNF